MNKILIEKIKESVQAVLPLTIVILIVLFTLGESSEIPIFLAGALMLIIGLVVFGLGAAESMMFIAEEIGSYITRKRAIILLIIVGLSIGFLITISEPSLWVLGDQFDSVVPRLTLILSISIGVAIFLVIGLLRIIFQIKLNILLLILFGIIFILAATPLIPAEFIPVAFDSGGVTTGPMAVPFIISLGLGIVSTISNGEREDSFGMVGIASIGPILAVFILGAISKSGNQPNVGANEVMGLGEYFVQYLGDMGIAILPFILFFTIFQIFAFKMKKKKVVRVLVGFLLVYVGLVIFLSGASVGFMSIGNKLGRIIAGFDNSIWLILAGLVFGFVIVSAEPSVVVLVGQVEEVTDGRVSKKIMMPAMAIGVSAAIGLAMIRIVFEISIWYILLPGYIIALVLTFFVPKMFTAIAFDSGGAVSGALTSTFLVPFALGAAAALEYTQSEILRFAFGLVAFVALAPLVTIQVLGLIFNIKSKRKIHDNQVDEIIELEEV